MSAADLLRPSLYFVGRWMFSPRTDWQGRRRRFELATRTLLPPRGTQVAHTPVGGVPAERLTPPAGTHAGTLLYLHGGGYCTGSPATYRALAARLGNALRCATVVPDYRLAPEHPWPAQLEDARAAYEGLLAEGVAPERVVVAGDSAGGHLTLSLALALRDAGLAQPAALGLISPWLDLREATVEARPGTPREPFLNRGIVRAFTRAALDGADPEDPLVSPVLADLRGLAPMVVHLSGDDHVLPDAEALLARAAEQGVEVEHRRLEGVWHVVHAYDAFLPGLDLVGSLARSLGTHLSR